MELSSELALILIVLAAALAVLWIIWMVQLSRARSALREVETGASALRQELAVRTSEAARVGDLEERLTQLGRLHDAEKEGRISAQTTLDSLRREHEARLEELRGMKKELEDRFESLASGVLQKNAEQFLGLVSERFQKHNQSASDDIEKRHLAISNLVKPLDEKLGQFDLRIKEIETARNEAYGAIREQVQALAQGQVSLNTETRKLVQALRAPKTRGRWGEMQLRQVFDMAGMTENVDYTLEKQINTDNGAQRPDAIVRIPGGKSIVIDAKTPLDAYLNALESETPELQQQQLVRHAGQIRSHVKLLSSKAYQDAIATTPDFVVMFIPGETFVSAAAESDPSLLEFAFANKILISTPTTLMALIKAIAYGWQQEKMAENAVEVQRVAKELYDRLGKFGEHLGKVGTNLNRAVASYNNAVGTMEGRVLPSARKFESMGVVPPKSEIEAPAAVETETRQLTASELTE